MALEVVDTQGVVVMRPSGTFVGDAAASVSEAIDAALAPYADAPKVVLNLEHVTTLDVTGYASIVALNVRVIRIGGRLAVVNIGDHLEQLLVDGALGTVFETFPDETAAVEGLRA